MSSDFQNVPPFPSVLYMWGITVEKSYGLGKGLELLIQERTHKKSSRHFLTLSAALALSQSEGLGKSMTTPWWNTIFLRDTGFLLNLTGFSKKQEIYQNPILQHSNIFKMIFQWQEWDLHPKIPLHFVSWMLSYWVSKQVLALDKILGNGAGWPSKTRVLRSQFFWQEYKNV